MNPELCAKLVPSAHLSVALDVRRSQEKLVRILFDQQKLPEDGWSDVSIEQLLLELSAMDSNNALTKCGLGEREGRIYSNLVARAHFGFSHGVGRSGDLEEAQPKAVGSSLMAKLTNRLLLDLIHAAGIRSAKKCALVPMATGMTLMLCFLALQKSRPKAKLVLCSRIDQKACFKSMITAGMKPIVVPLRQEGDELRTNVGKFRQAIEEFGAENILCIHSTTSCFAPRGCDRIIELAELAKKFNVPHVVNNAYGLQSTFFTHQIEQAQRTGRVDLFVQSTDKNLMVPVGGAIVAGFEPNTVEEVCRSYAGRASGVQTRDAFITLLSMGRNGYLRLMKERKELFGHLKERLKAFAEEHGEKVLESPNNPISIALTLRRFADKEPSMVGSMLFKRGVSGVRVLCSEEQRTICGHEFKGWGTHSEEKQEPYLTAAAAIGAKKEEIDLFIEKLEKLWRKEGGAISEKN